jgi:filamentous hemagglutinin family protein
MYVKEMICRKNWKLLINLVAFGLSLIGSSSFGQVSKDDTLERESSIIQAETIINGIPSNLIIGGATRGVNLFHSFREFNVDLGKGIYFNNPAGIERIITRVTGRSPSEIMGVLGIYGGNADLFFINPNGILFGPNASLDLKGSFLASTSSSITFSNTQYSAAEPSSFPLLSVNIPSGLKFRGDASGAIVNQSQVLDLNASDDPIGLRVSQGKTLALVGGDITLEGGILSASDGRIEIGSVAGKGEVSLSPIDWGIGYENVQKFGDISLQKSFINSEGLGEGQGNIYLQGKDINLSDGSVISSLNFGSDLGGTIKIVASNAVTLEGDSELRNVLIAGTLGSGDGGNIVIDANRLVVGNNAFIQTAAISIETANGTIPAGGNAGNVIITTNQADVIGGVINAVTVGEGKGGDIIINSDDSINISGKGLLSTSSEPVDSLLGGGGAGNITLRTRFLKISDGTVLVDSRGKGTAGNLEVDARSILLENEGFLSAQTTGGTGNITLNSNDIILRNNSGITTNATGSANGGNITINTGILLALPPTGLNGSDIKAIAEGGNGGNIKITAQGIFGIEEREASKRNRTNDIDASSQFGRSGQVDINTAIDPNNGLTELPETVVDPDTQVAQSPCNRGWGNELTISGRGGLPPSPSQDLSSEATQIKLVEPVQASNEIQNNPGTQEKTSSLNSVPEIAPAQGWVYNKKGQVVLVTYDPTVTGAQRLKTSPAGCPVP